MNNSNKENSISPLSVVLGVIAIVVALFTLWD